MAKSKASPHAVPSDDSKVFGDAGNVTPIKGRTRQQATVDVPPAFDAAGTSAPGEDATAPAIVVFGKDDGGKAHASRFGEVDADLAIKAAGLMGFSVLRATTPDIAAEAAKLPAGRIFAVSGRGFVPFCKMAAYEALNAFEGAFAPPPPPEPQVEPPLKVTGTPQRWEDIATGSLVLASTGEDQGWFEAVVTEARGDDLFVLIWRGWPDDPAFPRRRDGLALLPAAAEPDFVAPAAGPDAPNQLTDPAA